MTLPRFYPGCECDCHTATGIGEAQPGAVCVQCFCSAEFDRCDISTEVEQLCTRFQLEKKFVKEIRITPTNVTFVVYLKNEKGEKYVDLDANGVAVCEVSHEVKTA